MKKNFLFVILCLLSAFVCTAQTALSTSFESGGTPPYSVGNLNSQNGWTLSSTGTSTATIYTAKAQEGTQSVNLVTTSSAPLLNYVKYSGSVPGIPTLTGGSDVYADFWVNPTSIGTSSFAINGYDLYGGSSKRIFIIEFTTDNKIWAYNGSSRSSTVVGNWVANTWVRVSVKADFSAEKYKVAVNGTVYGTDLSFRESYTPTASGTRVAGIKELHSIRFSNLTETSLSTSDIAIDNVYVGTDAISDVNFGGSSTIRTITVTQPTYGSIALSPAAPYNLNQTVTATLTTPAGYINNGWTGTSSLTGTTTSPQTFIVTGNLTIGANVDIDPANPPTLHTITVTQPANGTISLSPAPQSGGQYYKETKITAAISFDACYSFGGWTGGTLSGTSLSSSFTVQGDAAIGASIIPNASTPVTRSVTTVANFKTALTAMNPGDIIEVDNGNYDFSSYTITRSGCEDKPIIIRAKNKGAAVLNGGTSLIFKGVNYITLSGFKIESAGVSTGIKLEDCSHVRITENSFKLTETSSCTWIYMGDVFGSTNPLKSGYNRIDHNLFDGKIQTGTYIKMDGNATQQTKYDTINYNHFKNNQPRATNEKECIRVGYSELSMSSGFTLIEYNLFENCDGDPEIVSIKSCDNTVRFNTFVKCLGTLSLRHGNRNLIEGNYFFGEGKTDVDANGCGGIRVYGKDHKIINNYFQGLTGSKWDAAITITNGDVLNTSTSLSSHFVPENVIIAHNTLVNNASNIEIGFTNNGNYNKAPINCLLANNLVIENTNPVVKYYTTNPPASSSVNYANNMIHLTGSGTVGVPFTSNQIILANPNLVQPTCNLPAVNCTLTNAYKVFRINAGSPAIDASTGNYADTDNEQQIRTGAKDIGADEYAGNATVYAGALDASHVGPDAIPFVYAYTFSPTIPIRAISLTPQYDQSQVRLLWNVIGEESVKEYAVEWSKNGKDFNQIAVVSAKPVAATNSYEAWHKTPASGINYYRIKVINYGTASTYSRVQSINTENDTKLHTYPNPATDYIAISGKISEGATVNIISSLGIQVKQVRLPFGTIENKISINDLPSGSYRLQVIENGQAVQNSSFMIVR